MSGFAIGQYLLSEWKGSDGKLHIGFMDENDPYLQLRSDDYPGNDREVLQMRNFKKEKTEMYTNAQNAVNQGLCIFPMDLNTRGEVEFSEIESDGQVKVRFEKANFDEVNALSQISLLKEEMTGMQKTKKLSGQIVYEQSIEAKQQGKHDDRVDCLCMMLDTLMVLREKEANELVEKPENDYKAMLEQMRQKSARKKQSNPFGNINTNPFAGNKIPFV